MHENTLEPVTTVSWPPPPDDHGLLSAADGLLVAELRGDIDLATVPHLRFWLDSVAALRAPAYVVDLRAVTFIDSTGLSLLLRMRRRALGDGGGFAVVCSARTVRVLRAHGSLDVLDPAASVDEAVARLAGS
ncbi:anti-sigma factor antagonist [Streptomyces sp. NPDC057257]|uniref:anti-sigma factor antagonist n=1 Tax=Streptomyces sp. NPDC057257 TaxID=3346071 RepID=UPI00362C5C2A